MAAAISIPCKCSAVPCLVAPSRRSCRYSLGPPTSPKYPRKKKQQRRRGVCCEALQEQCAVSRRQLCLEGAGIICYGGWMHSIGLQEAQAKEAQVGAYLPPAPSNAGFVQFKATNRDTPALRAGNVEPYQFLLPPTWKQVRVANILSGNYCQPKCAEPWVEVKFEDETQGIAQVVASPLIRLTNKPNARIEDIGSPEKLIASLGPFVTGNSYDPDELIESHVQKLDGQTYYSYTLETPYARTGTHNLAKATAKGNTVVLFIVSASDKQWLDSEKTLRTVVDSFEV